MKESIWGKALEEIEYLPFDAESLKKAYKMQRAKKMLLTVVCTVLTICSIYKVWGKEWIIADNPKTVTNMVDSEFTSESSEGAYMGGNEVIHLEDGKYRVVKFEIPDEYEIADLYIKTVKTDAYLEEAHDILKRMSLIDEDDMPIGAWMFPLYADCGINGLCIFRLRATSSPNTSGIGWIWLFGKKYPDGNHLVEGISYVFPHDPYIRMLEALSSQTSPETPAILVMGSFAWYVVIGDTAYWCDMNVLSDYVGYMPDFLGDVLKANGLMEDDLETIVLKLKH